MDNQNIVNTIEKASKVIGKTWPLYAFVTSNPLSGYEGSHFIEALNQAEKLVGGNVYPEVNVLEEAWQTGQINNEVLKSILVENKIDDSPSECLDFLKSNPQKSQKLYHNNVDRILVKWLMAFLDEGLAEWQMPNKEKGFFKAWKSLAEYDKEINKDIIDKLPDSSTATIQWILKAFDENHHQHIIEHHIAALPGWAGYVKYRTEEKSIWQDKFNLTLVDYLAVRLAIALSIDAEILPKTRESKEVKKSNFLKYLWLKAWETSFQNQLSNELQQNLEISKKSNSTPEAQLVFCIDTRSELIRRHVESKGNYETFGYAGFFGIAMDYENLNSGLNIKSCPPILNSAYKASETHKSEQSKTFEKYLLKQDKIKFKNYFLKRMKNMLPSAFGFVEGSGVFYGINMLARTLFPERLYNSKKKEDQSHEKICHPELSPIDSDKNQLKIEEKVAIVKSAFSLLGWTTFAEIVVFAGHGSHSKNNPFASSLDCGACAASPGRHNARMLARLANEKEVRNQLKADGFDIPDQTIFVGAEHNTTTDEIVLFDSDVPDSHIEKLNKLKTNLALAQTTATQERLSVQQKSVLAAHQKTNDWSETRPEWGLAKNKAFVIGSRALTKSMNLQGNCFLHSYEWQLDKEGAALEGIMQGPMVVTQWINNHYYFSTVDNENFGGGSKIFHNITGKFGVVMGNGSDLKIGLPLQSVKETDEKLYHQPLRLSVYIHAPKERIENILENNENLKSLLDNEWIYLLVIDPKENNSIFKYKKSLSWVRTFDHQIENA
ncbi:DUF2309 domain-containing protein [Flavobacteriaceae bacterium 14752]|uniref:DUF2309 domain-containing protein n=1 Tax=Mesohalobacter salilacus TaxID=2491711 RepID=UPI000F643EFD|nr:DUF2309 domain-containing protein [Flavobacteriaceae bacterium 14752]